MSGSGRNIGRAVVFELARRGCNVIVNGSSDRGACDAAGDAARDPGVEAQFMMRDVSRRDAVVEIAAAAEVRLPAGHKGGPADIAGFLVSDAGRYVNGQMIAANGGART